MRILVPVANRFLRPTNTDWYYAARTLSSLSSYFPDMDIAIQSNRLTNAEVNIRYLLAIARNRGFPLCPRSWDYALEQDTPVYSSDIKSARPDAILSYERYPSRSFGVPVVWITSSSYPEFLARFGVTGCHLERLLSWKRSRAQQASLLVFTTEVSRREFVKQNGDALLKKSVVIPFFIPGLKPLEDIASKWSQKHLRLLFVGREARRKGLPSALAGLLPLLRDDPQLSLTIVSRMEDGIVDIPSLPNITLLRETSRAEVLQLMADSHVLVMPSSWESYGFVYIEAMSQGCVPLALDHPVQRELLANHGILVPSSSPVELTQAVSHVLAKRDIYLEKAAAGQLNYRIKHSPEITAKQFYAACKSAC